MRKRNLDSEGMRKDLNLSKEQKEYLLNKIMKQINIQTSKSGFFYADEKCTETAIKRALEIKKQ